MATTVSSANISITISAALSVINAASTASNTGANPNLSMTPSITVGSSAGQVNIATCLSTSVTSGSPYTINLISGNDQLGNAMAMVHFCGFVLVNYSTVSGNNLVWGVGTHPAMGAVDTGTVYPAVAGISSNGYNFGCNFYLNPGWGALVAATNDTFTITAAAGTSNFSLFLFGRTA